MRALVPAVLLSSVTALPGAHHGPRLALTIVEPVGHRVSFRSVAVLAPHGLVMKYHYACNGASGTMAIVVAPSAVDYADISKKDVLARFQASKALRGAGAFTYGKGGWFRLNVALSRACAWTIRLLT